jgi:hypothetical protein
LTFKGIETVIKLMQFVKAPFPIAVTEFGIETIFMDELENPPSAIRATGKPL